MTLTEPSKYPDYKLGLYWLSPPSLPSAYYETQQVDSEVFTYNPVTTEAANLSWFFIRL